MTEPTNEHPLGKFDRFMLRLLRVGELKVHEPQRGDIDARKVIKLYWRSLRKFPVSISLSLTGVTMGAIIGVVSPYLFKQLIDMIGAPVGTYNVDEILNLVFYITGLYIVGWVSWRTTFLTVAYTAALMLAKLRQFAFSYLIEHSHQFFVKSFTGSLVQRVNRFAFSFDRIEDRIYFDVIPTTIHIIGVIYFLSRENSILTLVVLVWLTLFIGWNVIFAQWKLRYDFERAAQDSRTSAQLADAVTNQSTIELHRSHDYEKSLYKKQTELQSRYTRFAWQSAGVIDGVQALMTIAVEFVVMYVGVKLWMQGEISVGTFVLVETYVIQLTDRLWSFSRMLREFYEAFADAKEMAEILYTPHDITEKPNAGGLSNVRGSIKFDHVDFSFNEKKIIDQLTFEIPAGQKVALVGTSGAGKSTIMKLLFRQYDPQGGSITIDGIPTAEITLAALRGALSLVPQDPTLFHRSLFANIQYGRQEASRDEVLTASQNAHCHEFIEKLPLQYETLVGERGIRLSGGERQRVAIARAFLRNSPILVLDEATSSLDSESEDKIQDALMRLMEGKTTIIIAHRLSTIRRMDRIIVLENGAILEDGTHDELLVRGGTYARLWNIQQGGFMTDGEQTNPNLDDHHSDSDDE